MLPAREAVQTKAASLSLQGQEAVVLRVVLLLAVVHPNRRVGAVHGRQMLVRWAAFSRKVVRVDASPEHQQTSKQLIVLAGTSKIRT